MLLYLFTFKFVWFASFIAQTNYVELRDKEKTIIWCTVGAEEQSKCRNFSLAVEKEAASLQYLEIRHLQCKQVNYAFIVAYNLGLSLLKFEL